MFKKMKYIVIEYQDIPTIFLFQEFINHADMAMFLRHLGKPISAGFVDKDLHCYGESVSLELKADSKRDTVLLCKQMGIDVEE